MSGVFKARVVFTDAARSADLLAAVSVDTNGWVTEWDGQNVVAAYPPQSIVGLFADAPDPTWWEPGDQGRAGAEAFMRNFDPSRAEEWGHVAYCLACAIAEMRKRALGGGCR